MRPRHGSSAHTPSSCAVAARVSGCSVGFAFLCMTASLSAGGRARPPSAAAALSALASSSSESESAAAARAWAEQRLRFCIDREIPN